MPILDYNEPAPYGSVRRISPNQVRLERALISHWDTSSLNYDALSENHHLVDRDIHYAGANNGGIFSGTFEGKPCILKAAHGYREKRGLIPLEANVLHDLQGIPGVQEFCGYVEPASFPFGTSTVSLGAALVSRVAPGNPIMTMRPYTQREDAKRYATEIGVNLHTLVAQAIAEHQRACLERGYVIADFALRDVFLDLSEGVRVTRIDYGGAENRSDREVGAKVESVRQRFSIEIKPNKYDRVMRFLFKLAPAIYAEEMQRGSFLCAPRMFSHGTLENTEVPRWAQNYREQGLTQLPELLERFANKSFVSKDKGWRSNPDDKGLLDFLDLWVPAMEEHGHWFAS